MVVVNHGRFKNLKRQVNTYRVILNLNIQMINKDRMIQVSQLFNDDDIISMIEITRIYTKFFAG